VKHLRRLSAQDLALQRDGSRLVALFNLPNTCDTCGTPDLNFWSQWTALAGGFAFLAQVRLSEMKLVPPLLWLSACANLFCWLM